MPTKFGPCCLAAVALLSFMLGRLTKRSAPSVHVGDTHCVTVEQHVTVHSAAKERPNWSGLDRFAGGLGTLLAGQLV